MRTSTKMAALALAIAIVLPVAADAAQNSRSTSFNVRAIKEKPVSPADGKQVGTAFKDGQHVTGVFAPNGKPIFFYSDNGVVIAPNPYASPPSLPPNVARQHTSTPAGVPTVSYTMSPQ